MMVVWGCAASRDQAVPADKVQGPRFTLDLTPGPYYQTAAGWFIFKYTVYPQVAVWVEDADGSYLGTVYVTGKIVKGSWMAAPAAGRPEALPVWSHLRQGDLDSVSAATSAGETRRDSDLASRLPPGDYVVKLETNRSYDYNATYTKDNAGVCGQPSIVYRAPITVGKGPARAGFAPLGTGSLDGSDGDIHAGLSGIDTALELFGSMSIEYRER
jgi:hypothetical protein